MSDDPQKIPVTGDNLVMAFDQVKTAMLLLGMFDWQGFVEERNRLDSYLHITDPTLYRRVLQSANLADCVEAAKAAAAFVQAMEALKANAAERLANG